MIMEPLQLNWTPLTSIQGFKSDECKAVKVRAVYLWGFKMADVFVPYYVGKANHVYERALQHVAALSGGAYPIYHPDCLHKFHTHKGDSADMEGRGKLYSPEGVHSLAGVFRSEAVQQIVNQLLSWFRFTYAPIDRKDVETGWIEQLVADHFGRGYLQSSVTGNAPDLTLIHNGDDDIKSLFHRQPATVEPIRLNRR